MTPTNGAVCFQENGPKIPSMNCQAGDSPASERAIKELFPVFTEAVHARLLTGARHYGDSSLQKSPAELVAEVEEELFDVMGWTFLLWLKMRAIAEKSK